MVSPLVGCGAKNNEEVISLYSDSSRLYIDSLDEKGSAPLKTYHHKKFGEIPYVRLDEYCDSFPLTSIKSKKDYVIENGKFIVSSNPFGSYMFDAKKDIVTTSKDVLYFYKDKRNVNNLVPYDVYYAKNFERFVKGSELSRFISQGRERTYNCKKYNFDIVYENGVYYAPFSLLNSLFFEFGNETVIYNGKDYFDVDSLTDENPLVQYCYSSKGNFLLDLSGGKLGNLLFENKTPLEDEEYKLPAAAPVIDFTHFEAVGEHYQMKLKPEYDPAHVALKGLWRMPTAYTHPDNGNIEIGELGLLKSNTTRTKTGAFDIIGVGKTCTGPNGNSIFLPYSGYVINGTVTYSAYDVDYPDWYMGDYISSVCILGFEDGHTIYSTNTCHFLWNGGNKKSGGIGFGLNRTSEGHGFSIRPVFSIK